MNLRCEETEATPTIRRGRIVAWRVDCPTCGTIATGRTLKEVDDAYHAHKQQNQTPRHAPRKLGTIRLPI